MKLEDQLTSLELAKRLKELGVKQESYWCYRKRRDGMGFDLYHFDKMFRGEKETCAAFNVAELGEMLPDSTKSFQYRFGEKHPNTGWHIEYKGAQILEMTNGEFRAVADTEADARAKMLIYLLENNLISHPAKEAEKGEGTR